MTLPRCCLPLLLLSLGAPALAQPAPRPGLVVHLDLRALPKDVAALVDKELRGAAGRALGTNGEVLPASRTAADAAALAPEGAAACMSDCAGRLLPKLRAAFVLTGTAVHDEATITLHLALLDARGLLKGEKSIAGKDPAELRKAFARGAKRFLEPLVELGRAATPVPLAATADPPPALQARVLPGVTDPTVAPRPAALLAAEDAEAGGKEHPEQARAAWAAAVAVLPDGPEMVHAVARLAYWRSLLEVQEKQARRLRERTEAARGVVSDPAAPEERKVAELEEFAREFGADAAKEVAQAVRPATARVRIERLVACDGGSAEACLSGAQELADGAEPVRAVALFEKACAAGSAEACRLGRALAESPAVRAPPLERACNTGTTEACHDLAALYLGAGAAEAPKAERALVLSCNGKVAADCTALAGMVDQGQGGPRDPAQARTLYERACILGDARGCGAVEADDKRVADLHDEERRQKEARARPGQLRSRGWKFFAWGLLVGALGGGALYASIDLDTKAKQGGSCDVPFFNCKNPAPNSAAVASTQNLAHQVNLGGLATIGLGGALLLTGIAVVAFNRDLPPAPAGAPQAAGPSTASPPPKIGLLAAPGGLVLAGRF